MLLRRETNLHQTQQVNDQTRPVVFYFVYNLHQPDY